MNLTEALGNINYEKKNIIRNSDAPELAEKLYPKFPVARSLSYSMDCILLVNELNIRGLAQHDVSNKQHFEFLLNVIPKKKRYNKWEKPEIPDDVSVIMEAYNYSYDKAKDAATILTEKDIQDLKSSLSKGGIQDAKRKR